MLIQPERQSLSLPLRFLGGVVAALALALLLFAVAMQPPFAAFQAMTLFLSATALLSLVAGYVAYRFGWLERSPRLRWTFVASYLLAGALTFVNVWVTARLMFNSDHDLTLAAILLVFAVGIATALGFFLSAGVTDNIQALARAAGAVAQGRFDTRVAVRSRDEVAQLANAFNAMAAQLELAEQQKREVEVMRRDLIAWIGHDLRTPLASVQARLEALADGVVDDPATVQRYLSTAQRDLHSLSALIDDLFEMAQLDAGGLKLDLQPNSLSDLISDALESFMTGASAQKVNLSGTVAPDVDPVLCDARLIGRALNNLIGNALHHTPAGGSVHVQAWVEGAAVRLQVSDNGDGIEPEDLPHVFDRFFRGDKARSRSTGGAGLGLAITQAIVVAHQGTISVTSRPGQGSAFLVTIPTAPRHPPIHPLQRARVGARATV